MLYEAQVAVRVPNGHSSIIHKHHYSSKLCKYNVSWYQFLEVKIQSYFPNFNFAVLQKTGCHFLFLEHNSIDLRAIFT